MAPEIDTSPAVQRAIAGPVSVNVESRNMPSTRNSSKSSTSGRNTETPGMESSDARYGTDTGVKSSTSSSSGTSMCFGVSPPRSTLSEAAISSTPSPLR